VKVYYLCNINSPIMRNLYIVRGLPGSGKSTFAKFVGDSFVEADMFFMKNGKYEFDMSKIRDAHSWCLSTVREWMQMNADTYGLEFSEIAVSNTFTQEWEMEAYYNLAKEFNYTVFSLIVENRHGGVNTHGVPEEKLQAMKDRFEIKL
jgi:predicted kinase